MSEDNVFVKEYYPRDGRHHGFMDWEDGGYDDGWVLTLFRGTEFSAHHSIYGHVWGDFEYSVYANNEEGFNHFIENHPPSVWLPGDF